MRKIKILISLVLSVLMLTFCLAPAMAYDVLPEDCVHGSYEWVTETPADCTQNGYMYLECTLCGQIVSGTEGTVIPATGHKWNADEGSNENACLASYTCEVCGETKTVRLQNGEHSWDDGTVMLEPNCASKGYKVFLCTVEGCGAQKSEAIPETRNHIDTDSNGLCDRCGVSMPREESSGISLEEIFRSFVDFFTNLFNRIKALFS
ncbi:MAG: hypothetical protein J1E34_00115 [Oscillospiraceae bacterium]|nr:hypothetical protein [Oscillospiraceae bacterium]